MWPVNPERIARGQYWEKAWTLVEGCTPVSHGCNNCWSARETAVRAKHPNQKISTPKAGLVDGMRFNGGIRLRRDTLDKPLHRKKPTVYAIWNDLFHEDVPEEFIGAAFTTMMCGSARINHKFLVLTKRAARMAKMLSRWEPIGLHLLCERIFLGVSVENQKTSDERIPYLLQIPMVKKFVSYEPALGPVDFKAYLPKAVPPDHENGTGYMTPGIDWLVMGGESGPGARPMHPDWARSARDQCQAAGVPFFFKGFGEYIPSLDVPSGYADEYSYKRRGSKNPCVAAYGEIFVKIGKKGAGCLLDGREWKELPR